MHQGAQDAHMDAQTHTDKKKMFKIMTVAWVREGRLCCLGWRLVPSIQLCPIISYLFKLKYIMSAFASKLWLIIKCVSVSTIGQRSPPVHRGVRALHEGRQRQASQGPLRCRRDPPQPSGGSGPGSVRRGGAETRGRRVHGAGGASRPLPWHRAAR